MQHSSSTTSRRTTDWLQLYDTNTIGEWSLKSALFVLKHQHQMPKGVIRPIEEIVWKEVLARLEHDANIRTLESLEPILQSANKKW
ncbi:hypothetical protein PCASD_02285 [Puccinia coronata f. sp. avenae]|uniref:Uncharacterized protein n=1 Tax=Puccinia coronata f. sp. avenae TaxID=200324 RepID=A0A2N5VHX0_9BASI|nr:hypothetical protein PCASD_02285 [Puccinia coronata f. sp. avenae]